MNEIKNSWQKGSVRAGEDLKTSAKGGGRREGREGRERRRNRDKSNKINV